MDACSVLAVSDLFKWTPVLSLPSAASLRGKKHQRGEVLLRPRVHGQAHRRKSPTVCVGLKRPASRAPSGSRTCTSVTMAR